MRPVLVAIAVVAAFMSSCAKGGDGNGVTSAPELTPTAPDIFREIVPLPNDPAGGSPKSIDITDRSICNGPTPEMTWLFSSSWSSKHKLDNGVQLERIMTFSQTDVEVAVNAKYKGSFKQIKVVSDINWSETDFNFLSVDQDQVVMPLENEDYNLAFSISPSTVKYSFVGPCLQIEFSESEKLTFVPVIDQD